MMESSWRAFRRDNFMNSDSQQTPSRLPADSQQTPSGLPANSQRTPSRLPADSHRTPSRLPADSQWTPRRLPPDYEHSIYRAHMESCFGRAPFKSPFKELPWKMIIPWILQIRIPTETQQTPNKVPKRLQPGLNLDILYWRS